MKRNICIVICIITKKEKDLQAWNVLDHVISPVLHIISLREKDRISIFYEIAQFP